MKVGAKVPRLRSDSSSARLAVDAEPGPLKSSASAKAARTPAPAHTPSSAQFQDAHALNSEKSVFVSHTSATASDAPALRSALNSKKSQLGSPALAKFAAEIPAYLSPMGVALSNEDVGHVSPITSKAEQTFRGASRSPFGAEGLFVRGFTPPGKGVDLARHVDRAGCIYISMTDEPEISLDYAANYAQLAKADAGPGGGATVRGQKRDGVGFHYVIDNTLIRGLDVNKTFDQIGTDAWHEQLKNDPDEKDYWLGPHLGRSEEREVAAVGAIDARAIVGVHLVSNEERPGFQKQTILGEHGDLDVWVSDLVKNPNYQAPDDVALREAKAPPL